MRKDSKNRDIFDLKSSSSEIASFINKEFDWIGCIPDSMYKIILEKLSSWRLSSRENHLVGEAFGVKLGGLRPLIMIQNSGIGLCLDALLGTFHLHGIGVVIFVTIRGTLDWEEIQHQHWGKITKNLLNASEINFYEFNDLGIYAIQKAIDLSNEGSIAVVIFERGNIDE